MTYEKGFKRMEKTRAKKYAEHHGWKERDMR